MSRSSRSFRLRALAVAAAALVHLAAQGQLAQAQWRIEAIPTLGGNYSTASAINNSGQVTGTASLSDGSRHAFRYTAGVIKDLQPFPSVHGEGNAINARGDVAGTSHGGGLSRGFVAKADGALINLGTLGGLNSYAYGINDAGVVTGAASLAGNGQQSFLYRNGTLSAVPMAPLVHADHAALNNAGVVVTTGLDSGFQTRAGWSLNGFTRDLTAFAGSTGNGFTLSRAQAVNGAGVIVGSGYSGTAMTALLLGPQGLVDLTPFTTSSIAYAVNAAGLVVGSTNGFAGGNGAFLHSNGQLGNINDFAGIAGSGWSLHFATGINDNGQIVGGGTDPLSRQRGFLLTLDTTVWTAGQGGDWDGPAGWSHGIGPNRLTAVVIDPARSLTVTGPLADVQVQSLTIGGSGGVANLRLAGGTIEVLGRAGQFTTVGSKGLLSGDGAVTGTVTNLGRIDATHLTLAGGLDNRGMVTGHGILATQLSNQADGTLQLGAGQVLDLRGSSHANGGLVQVTGGGELRVAGSLANTASGQVFVRDGSARFIDTLDNQAGGRIQLSNALLRFDGGLLNAGQLLVTTGGAQVFGRITTTAGGKVIASGASQSTFYDGIEVQAGGELRVSSGSRAVFFGAVQQRSGALFSGSGTKQYEGGLSIGDSPGLGTDDGDVEFGAGNLYLAEIGGTARGTGHDAYLVAGALSFGGTLRLVSWNGFTAQAGQRFDLFDWGTVSGQFDQIDASGFQLAGGTLLDTSQLYIDGSVGVLAAAVPEPGSWGLMALGLAGLGLWRRRGAQVD